MADAIEARLVAELDEAVHPKPENDPEEIFKRQLDFIKPENLYKKRIVIIGCGSTGSSVGLLLVKTGFTHFELVDFDKVSVHNLSNQLHSRDSIDKDKTASLEALLRFQSPVKDLHIHSYNDFKKVTYDDDCIVLFCVDSMGARRVIYEQLKKDGWFEPGHTLFMVDIRVGGFKYNIYSVLGSNHRTEYENSLEGDPAALPCHAKSYMISSVLASSLGCQLVFDYMRLVVEKSFPLRDWMAFGTINNGDAMYMSNTIAAQKLSSKPQVTRVI
jgi:molybdopterin/thiamine biosynthesis adenylyltransferase